MNVFQTLWLMIVSAIVFVEGIALGRREKNDTLSEQVWSLGKSRLGRFVLLPLMTWLLWHFCIEAWWLPETGSSDWDDLIIVASAALSALFFKPRRS